MMQINFKIIDDRLALVGQYQRLVSGNTNTYVCKFENNNTDESLTWYAVFYANDGCAYRQEIQNGECYIPGAAIKAEHQFSLKIGVYGTVIAEDEVRRVSTNLVLLNIVAGGYCEEAVSDVPSHDVWEEMVLRTIPLIGENGNWYIYDPEKKDYVDTLKPARGPKYVLTDEDKLDIAKTTAPILQPNIDTATAQAKQYADSKDSELKTAIEAELDLKADSADVYTKTETDGKLDTKANSSDVYTKTETDGKLDTKVDKEDGKGLSENDYTNIDKAKVDNLPDNTQAELDTKADSADLADYVKFTDYATTSKAGAIKVNGFGLAIGTSGTLSINAAKENDIKSRKSNFTPIVPSNLDYAVSKSTHQDMSEDYDTSTLIVSTSFEGNQGQLPVSYNASKGYIDEKFNDSTPIAEVNDTAITVTDHLEGETVINYKVYGNSTQATRSGKNLLPYPYSDTTRTISGITFTDNKDGTITLNGTSTFSETTNIADFYLCRTVSISAGTYTLSGCPSGGSTYKYRLMMSVKDSEGKTTYSSDVGQGYSFTVNTDAFVTLSIRIGGEIGTISNLVFKPQLELGSTATSYEQYGVSPSPDYPSEVKSVGDLVTDETSEYYGKYDVPVTVCGNNLFDISKSEGFTSQYTGLTNTISENIITVSSTANRTGYLILGTFKAGTYYIGITSEDYSGIYVINVNGTIVSNKANTTITVKQESLVKLQINMGVGETKHFTNIQITKSSEATSYEPYTSETKHIYLDEPLRKVGDYADYVDFENQKVIRQVQEVAFDGTENWVYQESTNIIYLSITNNNLSRTFDGYSTHFLFDTYKNPTDPSFVIVNSSTPDSVVLRLNQQSGNIVYSTTAEFKTFLAEQYSSGNPVKLVGYCYVATEDPITMPELTTPNSAVMNVSSSTATQPSNIYIKYYQDINKKLDEIHTNYVKFTDYATTSKAGVVKTNGSYGISITSDDNTLSIARASLTDISQRANNYKPIVPSTLNYAVRSVSPEIRSDLTKAITVNTIYNLGLQTSINITLPSGQLGDFIQFDFISGETKVALSISSTNGIIGDDLSPESNMIYSMYFDWGVIGLDTDGATLLYGWRFNYSEYPLTSLSTASTTDE